MTAPAIIDDWQDPAGSERGAWQTALAHSPALHCGCCGVPAHQCLVFAGTADAAADTPDGAGLDPFAAEHLS